MATICYSVVWGVTSLPLKAEPTIMAQFFRLKNLFHEVFPENAHRRPSEVGLNGAIYNPAPLINNY
jgi:hypothetical protein